MNLPSPRSRARKRPRMWPSPGPFPWVFCARAGERNARTGPSSGGPKGGVPGSVRPWTKDGGETWGSYKSPEMGIWSRGYPEIGWNWMKLAHRTVKYWMVTIVKGCDMMWMRTIDIDPWKVPASPTSRIYLRRLWIFHNFPSSSLLFPMNLRRFHPGRGGWLEPLALVESPWHRCWGYGDVSPRCEQDRIWGA